MPCRAESLGGGSQQARRAAYISRIESNFFSSSALSPRTSLIASPSGLLAASFSSVETMVSRRSWPIGGRYWGKHGPRWKTPQKEEPRCTPDPGRTPGVLGETGVPLVCGIVFGLDGLKIGACGGASGIKGCAGAYSVIIHSPSATAHTATKSFSSSIRDL